jgi:hypothetical protein
MEISFGPGFDPFAAQRRAAELMTRPDPLTSYRRIVERASFIDSLASQRRVTEALSAAHRTEKLTRMLQPPIIDPLAKQRDIAERMTRLLTKPYEDILAALAPKADPLALQHQMLQRSLDPLARYEQILANFNALTGAAFAPPTYAFADVGEEGIGERLRVPIPSKTMAVHLLAIAWFLFCLLEHGWSVEMVGDLLIEALGQAAELAESEDSSN